MRKITTSLFLSLLIPLFGYAQQVFINEIHYDNVSTDVDEGVEIAGPAGTDLTNWKVVSYNGNGGVQYNTQTLVVTLSNSGNGFGFVFVPITGLQNGPDAVALVDQNNAVVQFLSYGGVFNATDGPAAGVSSVDLGVVESAAPLGTSLQLTGTGLTYGDFSWSTSVNATYNAINVGQTFNNPVVVTQTPVFINEFHYDNAGSDAAEGIEVAGPAGTVLDGWKIVFYNGSNGLKYGTDILLSGTLTDVLNGYGYVFVNAVGLQNGAPDGFALINDQQQVVQFLSYEGSFTANDGPAMGLISTDVGVSEAGDSPLGQSLQLEGVGLYYEDFTWAGSATATPAAPNNNQILGTPVPVVFINELHYDNNSTDSGEGVEIAATEGTDLTGWKIVLYNGNDSKVYSTVNLSGTVANPTNGFGFKFFDIPGIQNGSPDGLALINPDNEVIQFLSYEGAFQAIDGPAAGILSIDIGVSEASNSPVGSSLQLTGSGTAYESFTWALIPSTHGAVNTGQTLTNGGPQELMLITIAEARTKSQGTQVKIKGILTATDQLGGPAFIEDATAGIPIFDAVVHGTGIYQIGDELELTAYLGQFNNMIQLVSVSNVSLLSSANAAVPTNTTISGLSALEGQLIHIDNISFEIPGRLFTGNHTISDGTGSVDIRIDNNVTDLIGRVKPNGTTSITGVLGSFQGALQIFPRFLPDLPGTEEFVLQPPAGGDIPITTTLDVASWNMEFFGSSLSGYGPSDINLQAANARIVIDSLKADIIAVQEVSNISLLNTALQGSSYALTCSDVYSYSFDPEDPTFPKQQLCFIYNTETVSITEERVIFEEFYTNARLGLSNAMSDYPTGSAQSFWSSGRLPYMVTAAINIGGATDIIKLINVHGKSGSQAEDLLRRRYDYAVLKDTLDTYYGNDKLILLGDYNDDVDLSIAGGQTPLYPFLSDQADYNIISKSFSYDGQASTVNFSDVIDHMTISNELYDPYIEDSEVLLGPIDFINNYGNTTSDHYPLKARFFYQAPLEASLVSQVTVYEGSAAESVSLEPMVNGGVVPYSYLWSTGETSAAIVVYASNAPGVSLTITDAQGTQIILNTEILVVNALTVDNLPESILLKTGYTTELATYTLNPRVSGGLRPYYYDWSTGSTDSTLILTAANAGQVSLMVTDATGVYEVTKTINVQVENLTCYSGESTKERVLMCDNGTTKCVPFHQVEHFLSKGYILGSCGEANYKASSVFTFSNPFETNLNVKMNMAEDRQIQMNVLDPMGKQVYAGEFAVRVGEQSKQFNLGNLREGFYLVTLRDKKDPEYIETIRVYKRN